MLPKVQGPHPANDILEELGIPLAVIKPLELLLQKPCLLKQIIEDLRFLNMLSSAQSMTWFQASGHNEFVLTGAGCGPGDPLADLIHNIAMIFVFRVVERRIVEQHMCID